MSSTASSSSQALVEGLLLRSQLIMHVTQELASRPTRPRGTEPSARSQGDASRDSLRKYNQVRKCRANCIGSEGMFSERRPHAPEEPVLHARVGDEILGTGEGLRKALNMIYLVRHCALI